LNFVLAKSNTGVEVTVASAGEVAKVELYPILSGLSTFTSGSQQAEAGKALVLAKSGFSQDGSTVGYGMLIQNPNGGFVISNAKYQITYYDGDGNVAAAEDGYIYTLLPNQTLGVAGNTYLNEGLTVANAVFQVKAGDFEASDVLPTFTAQNINYKPDPYSPKVTGEIVSPYSKDITNLRVDAIAYNEKGDIIGGGYAYLDFVPANGKAAVEVILYCAGTPSKVELYAMVSALADIKP
jgi:hypothetical protein